MNRFEKNKNFLKRYKPYLRQIKRLEDRLYQLDDRIESTQSPRINGMPGGGIPRTLNDEIAERDELETRINKLLDESKTIKKEIFDQIDHLNNPDQSLILEMFFIKDINLYEISERLNYSMRNTTRLYSQGVMNILA